MTITRIVIIFCAVAMCATSGALKAQWLNHPTPGLSRLPNGKPYLNAPAAKTADGRPDLSGIFYLEATCPASGCNDDYQAGPEFINFGAKLPGGLPYQPWAAALVKERTAQMYKDDPVGLCRPSGVLRLLTFPPPRKFVQMPGLFLILSERDVTFRQIFTDGRPLPGDPSPSWNGYSVGRWEDDTLVVQTIGLRDGAWIDRSGSPLTESAKITERYRRPSLGLVQVEITVDDPKAYLRPWTVTLNQRLAADTELLDYHCTENEKDAGRLVGKGQ
jgi:hypothetical protein